NIRLVPAEQSAIIEALDRHYGPAKTESVDSMLAEFTDTAIDYTHTEAPLVPRSRSAGWWRPSQIGRHLGKGLVEFKMGAVGLEDGSGPGAPGVDATPTLGGTGMFFYVVEEGQRVLMRRPNGTMEVVVGPRRIWRGRNTFLPMRHHVATPGKFLIVR